ncbi:alpha/beta hydrolase [Rhodococcus sp. Leaf7]|uniref:alpha/beta fold hydrolase n=1 Tax=unclassified Rhodococcus (in: high G+C Gram-positive bacteria) TaxID=192944 RepID=UPI0006F5EA1F|nr:MULTISPECIES: alpha/beta hydrolase [unclassified Rhodococcus (in: high G+C Gram-positive bacteria)]KQU07106.1 alpha/beta hydrolase [Rhodococcus sp. Leaf7]KQU42624.1 alpha/beta hydrolase [Rhodococcus sp. Leaf247]
MPKDDATAVRHGYADTPLGQLHYAEAGSDGVPLICLHQTPRSCDEFAELLPLIASSRRVIAMDMYGFGQSAKPSGPQSIEQYASGALYLADALGLDHFSVLGHHTGAVVAVELAAAAAGRVDALVLSSPSFTGPEYRARHKDGPSVDAAERDDDGGHLITWWNQRAPYYPAHRPDLLDRFVRDALAPGVDPAEGHNACARYVMEDRIASVTAPVLILGGDADPFSFPDVEVMRRALVGASAVEIVVVEGGTIPMMEQLPVEVAGAVVEFLNARTTVDR